MEVCRICLKPLIYTLELHPMTMPCCRINIHFYCLEEWFSKLGDDYKACPGCKLMEVFDENSDEEEPNPNGKRKKVSPACNTMKKTPKRYLRLESW